MGALPLKWQAEDDRGMKEPVKELGGKALCVKKNITLSKVLAE